LFIINCGGFGSHNFRGGKMGTCETVKIVAKNKLGYIIVNKADMKKADKLFKEKKSVE